jgi:hypothetical protein
VATINTPGYLPMDDDPPVFDTPAEAWDWLCDERMRDKEESVHSGGCENGLACKWSGDAPYSDTVTELLMLTGAMGSGPGVVHGETPGYHGGHDLGLAFSVAPMG